MKREFHPPKWLIAIIVVAVMAAPAIWVVQQFRSSLTDYTDRQQDEAGWVEYESEVEERAQSIEGCKANNVLRRELHGFLADAVKARRAEGDHDVAASYAARADALVTAVQDKHPVAKDSPLRDCADAFPEPRKPDFPRPAPE